MNEENKIRQQFQSKFSDFQAPVPDDGWQRLEQSLSAASAAKVIRRRWYYSSAAAVLLVLIGSLLFLQNPLQDTTPNISEAVTPQQVEKQNHLQQQNETSVKERFTAQTSARTQKNRFGKTQKSNAVAASSKTQEEGSAWLDIIEKYTTDKFTTNSEESVEDIPEFNEAEKQQLIEDFIRAGNQEEVLLSDAFPRRNNKLMLSLSGGGGLASFQKTVNSPMMLRSASAVTEDPNKFMDKIPMTLAASNTANNIAEMEHSQPVSFGLMVSKSIFDDLSIETGLVYTYLYSKARNTSNLSQTKETQQFHYVGVPLNVNYRIFSYRNLDVYTTIGGMIERDVAGKRQYMAQTTTELSSNAQEKVTEKIRQENHQYSVNAGIGASYPIYNNLKLYGKMGGSYYFDAKNTYSTIYSDKKIMFDLNVGLRYEF